MAKACAGKRANVCMCDAFSAEADAFVAGHSAFSHSSVSPLFVAVLNGHVEVVALLISAGADMNAVVR